MDIGTYFERASRRLGRRLMTEPQQLAWVRASQRAHWLVVATVCVGAFMGQFDASVVSAALPRLADDFHATVGAVEWVALVYSVVLVASIVTIGHISDAAGRKLLYLGGFLVFTAGSALCGAAPTLTVLIAARALQALGAAMLQANSVALIFEAMPKPLLGRGLGWQSLAQALGLALGPALGGALLSFVGWRWLFWVNLPAGAIGLGLGWLLLPASGSRTRPDLNDGTGAALLALATALPLIYLSLAGRYGYGNAALTSALVAGLLFAGWFVVHEHRSDTPLIHLSMFRNPALAVGLGSGLVSYTALFGAISGVSYYLAGTHVAAWVAGAQLGVLPAALGITAPIVGRRVRHGGGTRRLTMAGSILTGVGLLELALWHGRPGLLTGLAVAGVGQGLFTPANNAGVIRAAPDGRSGLISGVLNMTRSMGTALGVALASLLYATGAGAGRGSAHTADINAGQGLTAALAVLGALALLTGVLLPLLPAGQRRRRRRRGRRGRRGRRRSHRRARKAPV